MVLDDLVHPYDTCLLRYIHASVYLNERGAFLKMVFSQLIPHMLLQRIWYLVNLAICKDASQIICK
jgi:hypothetical protein